MKQENTSHKNWLIIIAILLIASNLRAPIVAVGPVIPEMTDFFKLTPTMAGLITTIPLLCFGFGSLVMPKLSFKLGLDQILFYSIVTLGLGIVIRSLGSRTALFLGVTIVGISITVSNVLMPAFIKKYFPDKVGKVTAIYLTSLNLVSTFAVGVSLKMGNIFGLGWKSSIGIWFLLSVIAVFAWLPILKNATHDNEIPVSRSLAKKMWRNKLAWQISILMGTQSVVFYVMMAWFPTILQKWGMHPEETGWILSALQFGSSPMMILGPFYADKFKKQTGFIWVAFFTMLFGILLIIFFKTRFALPASLLLGISIGLAFALCMMFFILRTNDIQEATQLSGMAQFIGYSMAAIFPPLFGFLFGLTHSWTFVLWSLIFIAFLLLITGLPASKDQMIDLKDTKSIEEM